MDKEVCRAKRYSNISHSLELIGLVYLILVLFLFLRSGLSVYLSGKVTALFPYRPLAICIYVLVLYAGYFIISFPLNFYHSFVLEHRFSLSNQTIKDWLMDRFKGGLVAYLISMAALLCFYFTLDRNPGDWWWIAGSLWVVLSVAVSRLTPILILPLFFRYKDLSDPELKKRIEDLARKMDLKIKEVSEIDFSKKTLKANAALVGLGSTRRVVLADTLKEKYTQDEIEVIIAHEFAHYKLGHIARLLAVNSSVTMAIFFAIHKTSGFMLGTFGLVSLSDLSALPLVALYFLLSGIIMQPVGNYLSRCLEKDADRLAVSSTGLKASFVSMMEKLARQNLADTSPNPFIKFFFYDHPPIDERIAMVRSLQG